jgi:hypothetical protein
MAVRVHLTHIPELDHLIALEYGRVDEGTPEESWRRVGRTMGYLYDASATAVGFKVVEASEFDVNAPEVSEIWGPPRFDAPTRGLTAASAGEIILAALTLFGDRPSLTHALFIRAAKSPDDDQALDLWLAAPRGRRLWRTGARA